MGAAAEGCPACNHTGYKGRVGIYQVMPVTEAMRELIQRNASAMEIAAQARREGVDDLRQAGLKKVRAGITSLEEVLAVTND
jgi:type IV pilus assembly protein PilB